ncbi:Uncharacterised protein [Chlamydia trachomatis]|nr:Uncharacterised protein [Chlamydia trachomatis]
MVAPFFFLAGLFFFSLVVTDSVFFFLEVRFALALVVASTNVHSIDCVSKVTEASCTEITAPGRKCSGSSSNPIFV